MQGIQLTKELGSGLPTIVCDPDQVQQALLTLAPDLRAAVVLYDIEGQSYREIAEVLGVPEGTVKSRIHRGRQALREELRQFVRNQGSGDPS